MDLLVCAGGFEDRAQSFVERLDPRTTQIRDALILRYESQPRDNDKGYWSLKAKLDGLALRSIPSVPVNVDTPVSSLTEIRRRLSPNPKITGT